MDFVETQTNRSVNWLSFSKRFVMLSIIPLKDLHFWHLVNPANVC